jgi:hypothetical protein
MLMDRRAHPLASSGSAKCNILLRKDNGRPQVPLPSGWFNADAFPLLMAVEFAQLAA